MTGSFVVTRHVQTARHRTAWIEAGPADRPLMIFIHGWPELGIVWRAQVEHLAAAGWRCIAPGMRGYGGSSAPTTMDALPCVKWSRTWLNGSVRTRAKSA